MAHVVLCACLPQGRAEGAGACSPGYDARGPAGRPVWHRRAGGAATSRHRQGNRHELRQEEMKGGGRILAQRMQQLGSFARSLQRASAGATCISRAAPRGWGPAACGPPTAAAAAPICALALMGKRILEDTLTSDSPLGNPE